MYLGRAGKGTGKGKVSLLVKEAIQAGVFRKYDPRVLSIHLKGLLEAGVIEPLIFSKDPWFDIDVSVSNAIDAFLRAYKPLESDSKG